MLEFARRYDPQWYHLDQGRAANSHWGGVIASGWFTASLCMRHYVDNLVSLAAADTALAWTSCAGSPRCAPVTSCG